MVDERKLLRLTARIQELARTVRRDSTESHVELGKRLAVVRELLERGEWLRWVAETKTFTDQAARNYMSLAAWAEERPRLFQAWKHLGTDKLYAIMKLDGAGLRELQRRKRHAVPETDKVETLEEMSSAEVHRLVAEMRGAETAPTIRRVLGSVRRSVKHMAKVTAELAKRRREVEREDAEALYDDLVAAAESLRRAFRL